MIGIIIWISTPKDNILAPHVVQVAVLRSRCGAVMDPLCFKMMNVQQISLGAGKPAPVSTDQIKWSGLLHTKFCLLVIYSTEITLVMV